MLTGIKAVIFDMDGTLLDSLWVWKEIHEDFKKKYKLRYEESAMRREIDGMSFLEVAEYFKTNYGMQQSCEQISDEWVEMAVDYYRNKVEIKKNAVEFMKLLKDKDIKIGISTSNLPELVNEVIDRYGLNEYIGAFTSASEVEAGKPHPAVYLKSAERLNVVPSDCIVFEDIPQGVMGAKNAGMQVCGVYDKDNGPTVNETKELADYFIYGYDEVLGLV
ncbi:MAG: HAD family phosphatase [Clostridiales bacterium]|nr:HAD family phosphatase [Clostridiales bacterium]